MHHIRLTTAQLKAAKAVMGIGEVPIDWDKWEEFKQVILTTPLHPPSEPTIGEIHVSEVPPPAP